MHSKMDVKESKRLILSKTESEYIIYPLGWPLENLNLLTYDKSTKDYNACKSPHIFLPDRIQYSSFTCRQDYD